MHGLQYVLWDGWGSNWQENMPANKVAGEAAEIAHIAIYLGKDQVTFDSIIDPEAGLAERPALQIHNFEVEGAKCRFIYFEKTSAKTTPPWLIFINEQLNLAKPLAFQGRSESANGILLMEIEDRVFAAAFGRSATSCLNEKALEPDFGIKTAMNMCGNEEVRQTKTQSTAVAVTHIDRQISKPSESFAFGLSEAEDLRYISANLKGSSNVTLQGRDSLTVKMIGSGKMQWPALISRCKAFLKQYKSKAYEKLFPNYRNFRAATEAESSALDAMLIEALNKRELGKFQLAIPEFLQDDLYSFSYTNYAKRENEIYGYLDIAQLNDVVDLDKVTPKELKSRAIFAYSSEDDKVLENKKWALYDCLIFEGKLAKKYFILNSGNWAEIDPAFYATITDFIKTKVREEKPEAAFLGIDISDPLAKQNRESKFNQEVVRRRPSAILFDRAQLRIGEGRKNKEFCDILDLDDDGAIRIVNTKQLKDGSAIVYLFSQAKFYCDAFLHDGNFLTDIRGHIDASPCPIKDRYLTHIKSTLEEHVGSDYRLCLWLLYDSREKSPPKCEELPIIAQYELKLMHDYLRHFCKFKDIVVRFIPVAMTRFKTARVPH